MLLFEAVNIFLKPRSTGEEQALNAKVSCPEDIIKRASCVNAKTLLGERELRQPFKSSRQAKTPVPTAQSQPPTWACNVHHAFFREFSMQISK